MKVVECTCKDCRANFKIERKRGLPPWKLLCPVCGSNIVEITKINGGSEY